MADYATRLRDHVCFDLPLGGSSSFSWRPYVPKLQCGGRGVPVPVLAEGVRDPLLGGVRQDRRRLCRRGTPVGSRANGIPVRRFAKGENKEAIARPLIEAAEREGGDGKVVLIGITQEKTPVWAGSWKAKGQEHAGIRTWNGAGRCLRQPLRLLYRPESRGRTDQNGGWRGPCMTISSWNCPRRRP